MDKSSIACVLVLFLGHKSSFAKSYAEAGSAIPTLIGDDSTHKIFVDPQRVLNEKGDAAREFGITHLHSPPRVRISGLNYTLSDAENYSFWHWFLQGKKQQHCQTAQAKTSFLFEQPKKGSFQAVFVHVHIKPKVWYNVKGSNTVCFGAEEGGYGKKPAYFALNEMASEKFKAWLNTLEPVFYFSNLVDTYFAPNIDATDSPKAKPVLNAYATGGKLVRRFSSNEEDIRTALKISSIAKNAPHRLNQREPCVPFDKAPHYVFSLRTNLGTRDYLQIRSCLPLDSKQQPIRAELVHIQKGKAVRTGIVNLLEPERILFAPTNPR